MIERMKTSQSLLFLTLSVTIFLSAQDSPDMTILFDYFDSTVTIYIDGDEIVIEGDGVPSHFSLTLYKHMVSPKMDFITGWITMGMVLMIFGCRRQLI